MEVYRKMKPGGVEESRFFFKFKYWYKRRQTVPVAFRRKKKKKSKFYLKRAVHLHQVSWASGCFRHLCMEQILLLDGSWSQELKHKPHDMLHWRNSAGTGHIYLLPVSLSRCLKSLAQWTIMHWKSCKKFLPLLSAKAPLIFFGLQRPKQNFRKLRMSFKKTKKLFIKQQKEYTLKSFLAHLYFA